MAFKLKGPSTHKGTERHRQELKLNRTMDKTSRPDGRAGSSPMQLNPSKIDGVQVADEVANEQERKNLADMRAGKSGFGTNVKQPKVTRTGGSEAKHILANRTKKERMSGKNDRITTDLLNKARKDQADPKNYAAEKKQLELNKAHAKRTQKKRSPNKIVGMIDKLGKGVHSIKGTADELTGKAHMNRAMNQPITTKASGGLTKKEEQGGGAR